MRTPLQAHHFRMVRRQERSDLVPVVRVNVMIHPCLGHTGSTTPRNARSRYGMGVKDWRLLGLVGLVCHYWVLRRDLLIHGLSVNSNDAFEKRQRLGMLTA